MQKIRSMEMKCGAVAMAASKHPNEMVFKGVLVRLDEPSTKPPNGSDGHKIYVPTSVAKRRLKTLIGMGLNYSPDLKSHAQRRKVGAIKKAWIDGKDLWVSGVVWKHDFPEAEKDLKKPSLGMSMELGKVQVQDLDAEIWKLDDFYFLGATILRKDAAAYHKTLAIAAKAEERNISMATQKGKVKKAVEITPEIVAQIAAAAATKAVSKVVKPQFESVNAGLLTLATRVEQMEISASARTIETSSDDDEDIDVGLTAGEEVEDEEACDDMPGKMKASDDDDEDDDAEGDEEDMESASDHGIDTGDLEDMGPDTEDTEGDEPGELSKGAKNKGNKTSSENKLGKNINQPVTGAAVAVLRKEVKRLQAQVAQFGAIKAQNVKLKKRLARYEHQVTAASQEINRRSLSPELTSLLAKSSLDADMIRQTGQKLTVQDVDAVLNASGVDLDPMKRIELKNAFYKSGLMDDGIVERRAAGR